VVLSALAYGGSQVVTSWLVVASSGSAVEVGLLFALRMAPLVVVGPVAGALADRSNRSRLLAYTNLASSVIYAGLAITTLRSDWLVPAIWVATVGLGSLDAVRLATTGTLVVDAAATTSGPSTIASSQIAARIGAGAGGLAFGALLASAGPDLSFGGAAVLTGMAGLLLGRVAVPGTASDVRPGTAPDVRPGLGGAIRDGLALVARNRQVRLLAFVAIVAEILGFSNDGILPIFASQILGLGAGGLGLLYLAVRGGSVLGLVVLVRLGARFNGIALVALLAVFGAALTGFGVSGWLGTSLGLLGIAGAAAASIDALEQALMQNAVGAPERGRALGIWTICLGFGPLGFVALGTMAGVIGAPAAQVVAGVAMALIGLILLIAPGSVRDLRAIRTTGEAASRIASATLP